MLALSLLRGQTPVDHPFFPRPEMVKELSPATISKLSFGDSRVDLFCPGGWLPSVSNLPTVHYQIMGYDVYFHQDLMANPDEFNRILNVVKDAFWHYYDALPRTQNQYVTTHIKFLFDTHNRFNPGSTNSDGFALPGWVVIPKGRTWPQKGSGWLEAVLLHEVGHHWHAIYAKDLQPQVEALYQSARTRVPSKYYSMASSNEYFAESAVALFVNRPVENNWPSSRAAFRKDDPRFFELLRTLWGIDADRDLERYAYTNFTGLPVIADSQSYDGHESLLNYFHLKDKGYYSHWLLKDQDFSGKKFLEAHALLNAWGDFGPEGMTARVYVKTGGSQREYASEKVRISSDRWNDLRLDLSTVPNLDKVNEVGVQYFLGPTGNSGDSSVYTDMPRAR